MQRTSVVLEPTNNTRVRVRGPQRACETKIVAVGLNQAEETLSPFGVVGRVGGTPSASGGDWSWSRDAAIARDGRRRTRSPVLIRFCVRPRMLKKSLASLPWRQRAMACCMRARLASATS
jgi:hypothetical protein